jgi:signal transduction histidine kinase
MQKVDAIGTAPRHHDSSKMLSLDFMRHPLRAVVWFGFLALALCAAAEEGGIGFEWRNEGRSFQIQAPGLEFGEMHFGSEIERDGKGQVLDSRAGKPMGIEILTDQPGPYGKTQAAISTVRFEKLGIDLLLRIDRMEGVPCLLMRAGIRNLADRPATLGRLRMIDSDKKIFDQAAWPGEGSGQDWIVTGQHHAALRKTLADLEKPLLFVEEFGVYRKDGTGVFIGPVGEPAAYQHSWIARDVFVVTSQMFPAVLPPGEVRWGQQAGLFFEPPRQARRRWAEWVAQTHGARTSLGALFGWTDSNSDLQVAEKETLEAIDFVRASQGRLRPQAIVLDRLSDFVAQSHRENSNQLPHILEQISSIHAMPGLRLSLDDDTSPPDENLRAIRESVAMGFGMLKLIYPFAPAKPDGQNLTLFERQRKLFQAIRSAAGESTYLTSCMVLPKRAGLGFVDSTRSGLNSDRQEIRRIIENALWAFPLNRRWYAVDSDAAYLATEVRDVNPLLGGWPMARTWLSIVGLSCGNAFTGDLWFLPKFQPYIRNFEILQPPAQEETEILDLGTSTEWPRLAGRVVRPWGSWTVALLWNPGETERNVSLDLAEIGGSPDTRYAVWSFWDNAYYGVVEGTYTAQFLASSASQHLVFTELPRDSSKPILIGSNFHIYCGAAELKNVTTLDAGMAIEFTDAGAASGSLCVYSKIQPVISYATGCEVAGIESAGENVWRIDIRNRAFGSRQSVELGLPLPLYRQSGFWALSVALLVSAGFGLWKYLESLGSRRALAQIRSLHEERARIARDLHDELGSGLTHISILGDSISGAPDVAQRIRQATVENIRRLNEIVWALNPERDSLDHLADHLLGFAGEFLESSDIRLRSEIQDGIPAIPLTSKVRHALYLATREAFHNAVRHGHPTQITMRISIHAGILSIVIEDNGAGFDPSATARGHGLSNMRTRLEEIGGKAQFTSTPGFGTTITFTFPIPKNSAS